MTTRLTTIINNESIATAGTTVSDIGVHQPISALNIRLTLTNAAADPTNHPSAALTKIEIVDGSQVLYGLTGLEATALSALLEGHTHSPNINYMNSGETTLSIPIIFGRYLYDQNLALNPSKHNNLQIRITHNKALGGSSPDAGSLTVTADLFEDLKTAPIGYLSAKEQESYTLVASSNNYTDLPTDFPIRLLMLQSYAEKYSPLDHFYSVKLSADNDRIVFMDNLIQDLITRSPINSATFTDSIYASVITTTRIFNCTPSMNQSVSAVAQGFSATALSTDTPTGCGVDVRGASAADAIITVQGTGPLGAILIPSGDLNDTTQWLSPADIKTLKLITRAGSSLDTNPTAQIVTQQFVSYK